MAPHYRRKNSHKSLFGTLKSIVYICIGIVIFTVAVTAAADAYCRADMNHWMPVYPNAEVLQVNQEGFFAQRGMGISNITYITDDSAADVREWYRDYRREITRNRRAANANTAMGGIADTRISIRDNPDGDGTLINLYGECGYN